MNKQEAVKQFAELYPNYKQEAKKDYCKIQFIWSCFVDGLCKDNTITQKQYNNWLAPFQK